MVFPDHTHILFLQNAYKTFTVSSVNALIPLTRLRPLSMECQPQNTEFRNTPKFYRFLQQHIKYTSSDCFHSYIVVKAIAQFEDVRQKSMCLSRIHYSSDQKYVNDSLGT